MASPNIGTSASTGSSLSASGPWVITRRLISIEGPVELVDGNLMLRIPISAGGAELAPLAHGIGEIEGGHLCVVSSRLAEKRRISEGSLVIVDDRYGKFTITRSAKNDEPAR